MNCIKVNSLCCYFSNNLVLFALLHLNPMLFHTIPVKLATECFGILSKLCISFISQITNNTMKFFPIQIYCILIHSAQYSFLYNPVSSIIIILEAKCAGSYSPLAYDRLSMCFESPVLSRRYMYTVHDANNLVPLL